ncbi:hypothetical protein [Pedobacter sp. SYSU D00535]|uniref:hypothetical protein n=1 Tax=Pedobacter sp. SYSU D00535 TaxID=2810308 RepID=UPI001A957035|nr:hypothetical protein [Pedobacter sp. SYSU D00535]
MKALQFIVILALFSVASCTNSKVENKNTAKVDSLKQQKYRIDSLMSDESLLVFAKLKGKKEVVEIKGKRYPAGIETTYNVLKDGSGKVLYVAVLPFSESNNWFIAYKNYYDQQGNLIVFQRQNNFLKSKCTSGAALESLTKYYDQNFAVLDSTYTLTDSKKQALEAAKCEFPYNFPYKIYSSIQELKSAEGITKF